MGKHFPLLSGFSFVFCLFYSLEFQRQLESLIGDWLLFKLHTVALRGRLAPGSAFPIRDGYFTTNSLSLKIFSKRSEFSKRSLSLSRSVVRSSVDCFQTEHQKKVQPDEFTTVLPIFFSFHDELQILRSLNPVSELGEVRNIFFCHIREFVL